MSGKAQATEQGFVETVSAPEAATGPVSTKPSFKSRVAAHYKRWWWVHVIAVIVVVLVVTLPVVYVGYPNIAQSDINDSTLEVQSMAISDPAPDSFQLNQSQVIGSKSMYHPKIYAFNATVGLLGATDTFTTIQIPQIQAKDGTVVKVNQRVDLDSVSAFNEFSKAMILDDEVKLNVYGRPDLKEGSLPTTTVTYNKTVTMKGLNRLKGFKLVNMHLAAQANGRNTKGTVIIPNPSVMTLTMGNITLDLSVDGTHIGQSFIDDLVLSPGNNTVPMTAKVSIPAIGKVLPQHKNNILPVDIIGNSSVYNGQELPYFSAALAANSLQVDLNVLDILGGSV